MAKGKLKATQLALSQERPKLLRSSLVSSLEQPKALWSQRDSSLLEAYSFQQRWPKAKHPVNHPG